MEPINVELEITHGEVEKAIDFFLAKGGKVKILPKQKSIPNTMIGTSYQPHSSSMDRMED